MKDLVNLFPRVRVAVAITVVALVASGCATYQQTSTGHLNAFKAGNSAQAIAYYESNQDGKDKQLFMVEAGRLNLLDGDFLGSHRQFTKAIDQIFDVQEGSVIRLRDAGGTALASTFFDDRTRSYNLPSFEAVFAFQQQALNSIFLGDIQAASVEMRRAVNAQDIIAEKYEQQIEKARQEAEEEKVAAGMPSVNDYYANMGPVLGRAKSGIQNPYVWYFSGLFYELQGDRANAYIAYKKAWELVPDNRFVQRDLLRLGERENPEEWRGFKEQFGLPIPEPAGNKADVIIVYEEGLISQRHSVGIPVFVINGFQKVTFPVYQDGPYQPARIQASWGGLDAGELMPICYVQSLAYHDLRERIPGIAARNISRAISRELVKAAGRQSDNSLVQIVTLIGAGVASLADEADTRGWYSLPMGVQLLRSHLEPGEKTLRLSGYGMGRELEIPMTLDPGETKLVWIADKGTRVSFCVASLTKGDRDPAQFSKIIGGGMAVATTTAIVPQSPHASPAPAVAGMARVAPPAPAAPPPVINHEVERPPAHGSAIGLMQPAPRNNKPREEKREQKQAPITIF